MRNILSFFLFASLLGGQPVYDLLLKGGHVIDPKNNINRVMDVAVTDGKIARVAAAIGRDAGPDAATCIRGYLNRIEVI